MPNTSFFPIKGVDVHLTDGTTLPIQGADMNAALQYSSSVLPCPVAWPDTSWWPTTTVSPAKCFHPPPPPSPPQYGVTEFVEWLKDYQTREHHPPYAYVLTTSQTTHNVEI
jgi:hypothetical protein